MDTEEKLSSITGVRPSWEHIFVSGAKEWHTGESTRARGGRTNAEDMTPEDQASGVGDSFDNSTESISTSGSERNLFRMTDLLADKNFTFAPSGTPPTSPARGTGLLRGSSIGSSVYPAVMDVGRGLVRPASLMSSMDTSPYPGILRRRLVGDVSHGMSQAEFAVRREGKVLLGMVGLPARGKTYIAQSIKRHMDWVGLKTQIYNAGNYRRKVLDGKHAPASFFDPANEEGARLRQLCAELALNDALDTLASDEKGVYIAIFDATNTTRERRAWIQSMVDEHEGQIKLVLIETVLTDDAKVWENVKQAKLKSPDYKGMSPEDAMEDFFKRIDAYKTVYETCDKEEGIPFIRLTNAGEELLGYKTHGFICGRIMQLMGSLRLTLRPILLTRSGESEFEAQGRIGGDSRLTPVGQLYAQSLARGIIQGLERFNTLPVVWTSTRLRARQTVLGLQQGVRVASSAKAAGQNEQGGCEGRGEEAAEVKEGTEDEKNQKRAVRSKCASELAVLEVSALDEIDAGACEGMSVEDFPKRYPDTYQKRLDDKLNVKFPDGENYRDVFTRLESLLLEMLSEPQPVIVVGHLAVLRIIYGYFTGVEPAECPYLKVPMHCVVQLNPKGYGYEEWRHYPLMSTREEAASP